MSRTSNNILEVECLTLTNKPIINNIKFLGETKQVNPGETITLFINESFYDEDETKRGELTLFKDNEEVNQCIFDLFKGYNHCYCFLDEKGYTFQLLLKYVKDANESIVSIFKKFDTNETNFRKRYVFVNFSQFLFDINNITFNVPLFFNKISSYQLSVYNIEKKLAVYKKLKIENVDDNLFKNKYQLYRNKANKFREQLEKLIQEEKKKNKKFIDKLTKLMENNKELGGINFFLNQNNSKLEKLLNNENYIDFYINFYLYKIILSMNYDLKQIKKMVSFIILTAKNIKNDNIKIYQKILILSQFLELAEKFKNKKKLKDSRFSYYIMHKKRR